MSILKVLGLGLFVLVCLPIAMGTNTFAFFATIGFVVGSIVLYFCPTIIAISRNHSNKTSIIVLNLFLGWTIIGWVGALVWSYSAKPEVLAEVTSMPASVAPPTNSVAATSQGTQQNVQMKKCPFCAEEVRAEAIKCKHCGSDIANAPA